MVNKKLISFREVSKVSQCLILIGCTIVLFVSTFTFKKVISTYLDPWNDDAQFFEDWDALMKMRLENIRKFCQADKEALERPFPEVHLLWEPKSKMAYCGHGKVGSSSWLEMFFELNHQNVPDQDSLHPMAWDNFGTPTDKKMPMDEYVKVTTARHPLVRIASAYRDRAFDAFPNKGMTESDRDVLKWKTIADELGFPLNECPTFSEFVRYIVSQFRECNDIKCLDRLDPHFRPFYARCNTCAIQYQVITQLETFAYDLRYLRILAASKLSEEEAEHESQILKKAEAALNRNKSRGTLSTEELTTILFSLLTKKERDDLRRAYKMDLNLYGYDPYIFDPQI